MTSTGPATAQLLADAKKESRLLREQAARTQRALARLEEDLKLHGLKIPVLSEGDTQ